MIAVLSPALNVRPDSRPRPGMELTRPLFPGQIRRLVGEMRQFSPWELESLLRINPELAVQTALRFQQFDPELPGTAAILSYFGLAYTYLEPQDFTPEDLQFANRHLRLLSGLYGVLRPFDGILPHRLDFASRFRVDGGNLYRFWGDQIYRELFRTGETVVNLCSVEYAKTVEPYVTHSDQWITCVFLEQRAGGKLRSLATASKMARGRMARFLVKNRLEFPQQLWDFDWEGYRFEPERSTDSRYVFVRE